MPSKKKNIISDKKETKKTNITKKPVFYFFAVIIILIISISFIGGPLLSRWISNSSKFVFGSYAGKEIAFLPKKSNYFYKVYRENASYYQYMMEMYKDYFDSLSEMERTNIEKQEFQRMWQNSFNQTALHMAIMYEAEKSGLVITEDRVINSFFEFGPYIDQNGEYNNDYFKLTNKADRAEYQKIQYEDLIDKQYRDDLNEAVELGKLEEEIDFILDLAAIERKFSFVSYSFDDYPLEEILKYGNDNFEKFRKIKLSRITITTSKEDAEKIREMAASGETSFEDLAREFSNEDDPYKDDGGDMGWQYYYDLYFIYNSEDTVNSILNLVQDDISPVYEIELELEKRWVFYKANSYVTDPDLSDPELLSEIKDYISYYDQNIIELYFMGIAEEFKAKAEETDFSAAALEYDLLPIQTTDYFPINYGDIFQSKTITVNGAPSEQLSSVSNNEYFYEVLFSLGEDEISEPIVLNDSIIIVKMAGERIVPEEELETLRTSLENIKTTTMQRELTETVINDSLFVNSFIEGYLRLITIQN